MTLHVARGLFVLCQVGLSDSEGEPRPVPQRYSLIARSVFLTSHYALMAAALVLFVLVTDAAFSARHFQHTALTQPY